jgi:hypothetical protein
MDLNFFYILCYDLFIITNALNPNYLKFLLNILIQVFDDKPSSLFSSISSVKNCHFILRLGYIVNQIFKANGSNFSPQL